MQEATVALSSWLRQPVMSRRQSFTALLSILQLLHFFQSALFHRVPSLREGVIFVSVPFGAEYLTVTLPSCTIGSTKADVCLHLGALLCHLQMVPSHQLEELETGIQKVEVEGYHPCPSGSHGERACVSPLTLPHIDVPKMPWCHAGRSTCFLRVLG